MSSAAVVAPVRRGEVVDAAAAVAERTAGPAADAVDREARFPSEAVDELRRIGLLGSLVPEDLGGIGAPITEVAASVTALARGCSSGAMVLAMHHIQVHCLVRHASTPYFADRLRRVASGHMLLASATTEATQGGDVRSSTCAVLPVDGGITLEKQASVISYGDAADAVLTTARATPDSPPNDQVLVLCDRPGLELEATGGWDTMGFRGTSSLGYRLRYTGPADAVVPEPFATISSATMLPTSHLLWSAVWLGIATEAVHRARAVVRAAARKTPGTTPPSALRLADLVAAHRRLDALVRDSGRRYEAALDDEAELGSLGFAIAMNDLKVSSSTAVVEIVTASLGICGIAGYREDGPLSVARLLRDAHAAPLMISNDRILGHNAQLLLVHKGD